MIKCACGKVMDRVPDWMAAVKVNMICQNCPSRDLQSIADVKLVTGDEEPVKKKKQATK